MTSSLRGTKVLLAMLAGVASGTSCAIEVQPGWKDALELEIGARRTDFSAGNGILAGIDGAPTGSLASGDQVLFGVCLEVGSRRTVWYLHLEVVDIQIKQWRYWRRVPDLEVRGRPNRRSPEQAQAATPERPAGSDRWITLDERASDMAIARIRVEAFDSTGRSLGIGDAEEAVQRLETGLHAACLAGHAQRAMMRGQVALNRNAEETDRAPEGIEDLTTVAEGVAACEGFFAILNSNPVTRRILNEVIALPSLWSMITNFGVNPGFSVDFFAARRVEPGRFPDTDRELWSVPLTVDLNDQPGLLTRIIVGPSGSPDGAAAGVYGLVGQHPADPHRHVHVKLLASKRRAAAPSRSP